MVEIVLATGNPHKVEEMSAIFAGLLPRDSVRLVGLKELPDWEKLEEPKETGGSFEANATIKALSYAHQTGRLCLADDSGLEIDALGGRPGVISSHYCTDGREEGMSREERDRKNNERVLRELEGIPEERRGARFVCVMVLAGMTEHRVPPSYTAVPTVRWLVRGTFEGKIGLPDDVPRGVNGFGYDPIFLVAPEFRLTSAELQPDAKNRMSHRGAAARAMSEWVQGNLLVART